MYRAYRDFRSEKSFFESIFFVYNLASVIFPSFCHKEFFIDISQYSFWHLHSTLCSSQFDLIPGLSRAFHPRIEMTSKGKANRKISHFIDIILQ